MKRIFTIVFFVVIAFGASLPAAAKQNKSTTTGNINVNYWMSDISLSGSSADQAMFPMVTGAIDFSDKLGVAFEYSTGDDEDLGTSFDTTIYTFGVKYNVSGGWYANLSYGSVDTDLVDSTGLTGGINVEGFRLGGGVLHRFEQSPWSMNVDFGLMISPDADIDFMGQTASVDGDEYDATMKLSYRFDESGFLGNIGYKYVRTKASNAGNSVKLKYDGLFLGFGYEWK